MTDRQATPDALPLIEALFNGTIDDAGFDRLDALLREDDRVRELYRSMANLQAALPSIVGEAPRLNLQIAESDQSPVNEAEALSQSELLQMLVLSEQRAQAVTRSESSEPVSAHTPARERRRAGLTRHDFIAAGSYLFRHAFTPHRVAILATAAALVLGVLLTIVLLSEPDGNGSIADAPDTAEAPDAPASVDETMRIDPSIRPVVATLTATHHAVWSNTSAEGASALGSLQPGSQLHPGDRITLTQGFAEITTKDGAIAILQAPATVELIDHDNAIRLHAGKLVGICETESSKGFVVRTDQADIIDVGTRFGVQHATGLTQVSVLEGHVIAQPRHEDAAAAVSLVAGQHAQLSDALGRVVLIDTPRSGFVANWSHVSLQPRLSGEVRYEAQMPPSLMPGDYEGDLPVLYTEKTGVQLPAAFEVSLSETGEYPHNVPYGPVQIGKDQLLDCYLVHFDPPGEINAARFKEPHTRTGTIQFDRPIVGVITMADHMLASAEALDRLEVQYRPSQEEDGAGNFGSLGVTSGAFDTIRISEDRKTLDFTLRVGPYTDQFRILLQANASP